MGIVSATLEACVRGTRSAIHGLDRAPLRTAIIGTEGSGKTIFIAALARQIEEAESTWLMDPVDMRTQAYVVSVWETLRRGEWPSFTSQASLHDLDWNLRFPEQVTAELRLVDASGHRLRELFAGDLREIPEHLRPLADYCRSADVIVLLINLQDFVGEAVGEQRSYNELALKFALDYVGAKNGEKHCCAVFTQTDLYSELLETHLDWNGVAQKFLPKLWGAHFEYGLVPIFGVSAVDRTEIRPDERGTPRRFPAKDFSSAGFAPVLGWLKTTLTELHQQHARRDFWYRVRGAAIPLSTLLGCVLLWFWLVAPLWAWMRGDNVSPNVPKIVILERWVKRDSSERSLAWEGIKPVWRTKYRFQLYVKFRNEGADGRAVVHAHYRKGDYEGRPSTGPFEILRNWEYDRSFWTEYIDAEQLDLKTIDVEVLNP